MAASTKIALTADRVQELKAYIRRFQHHCDIYLTPLCSPRGKRVLVIGSGWGTETFWALRNGAREVVGIDPASRSREPLCEIIDEEGISAPFSFQQGTTIDLPQTNDFDLIVSNNVFEHIFAIKATLRTLRGLLAPAGRIAIFASPLFYSSCGAHLPFTRWEHLSGNETEICSTLRGHEYNQYRHGLNEMTITDFLGAVRESGLVLLNFSILPDRNIRKLNEVLPHLQHRAFPMDLALEGISALLAFPEHI